MENQSQRVSINIFKKKTILIVKKKYYEKTININYLLGSRITSIFNFGYVSLNIMHLRAEDAGSYTVRAVNRLGEAISSATLRVFGES